MEAKSALEIVVQEAAGLVAVHKQNLVHRDIKPSNIMVSFEEGLSDCLNAQDRLLLEFQNRADVLHRRNIETGLMATSNYLLMKLTTMARHRNLAPVSSGMSYRSDSGTVYFQFGLKFADGENISSDVCHWIGITGENRSYLEASFDFVSDPRAETLRPSYYRDSVSDINRLRSAVDRKATEIFAELLRRLREAHS